MGRSCDAAADGYFVPNFDFLTTEAEGSIGAISNINGYRSSFTGFGFARINGASQIITFFTPQFTSR